MAYIKKIKEGTETIYPATIPQAVVDPTSGKTVRTELDEKATSAELVQLAGDVSVKIANLIVNGDFRDGGFVGWIPVHATLSVESESLKITSNSTTQLLARAYKNVGKVNNSKFYTRTKYTVGSDGLSDIGLVARDGEVGAVKNQDKIISPVAGTTHRLSILYDTGTLVDNLLIMMQFTQSSGSLLGKYINATDVIHINLTATFGAENEPTKEEMDLLISTLGIDYFEGEITIPAQKVMQWQLKMIRQNRSAIIALGGTII